MDVRRNETGRQPAGALDDDRVAVNIKAARSGCDQRAAAAGCIALV
jgi:hypothetical protein